MSDQIRVNGNVHDWGSIIIVIDGERYYGFTGISWSQKRPRTKTYGVGRHRAPRGRTRGKYSAEAKLSGPPTTVQSLIDALAARSPDGVSYGDVEFLILVQYVEETVAGGEMPMSIEIVDCVIDGEDASHEDNDDPLKEEIGIDCMYIKRNGKTLFQNDGTR